MNEKPILFSAPMVRAILAGRKNMTRRVVKPQPVGVWAAPGKTACPYGRVDDRLWVREKHARTESPCARVHYFADNPQMPTITERHDAGLLKIYPSIFMPRWASRITLEIINVRVERLQEITEEDAIKEGILKLNFYKLLDQRQVDDMNHRILGDFSPYYVRQFQSLWNSINGKTYPWSSNPFVWVIEFKRMEEV